MPVDNAKANRLVMNGIYSFGTNATQQDVVRNSSVFHVKNDGNIMRGFSERHQRSGVKNESRSIVVHPIGGYSIHAVLTITQLLDYWEETGKVDKGKIEETRKFLKG